jgi:hypothetical protein
MIYTETVQFERLNDEELADSLAAELGVATATALRAIRSDDPDLGRGFAIRLLEAHTQHRAGQQQLTTLRRNLRSV